MNKVTIKTAVRIQITCMTETYDEFASLARPIFAACFPPLLLPFVGATRAPSTTWRGGRPESRGAPLEGMAWWPFGATERKTAKLSSTIRTLFTPSRHGTMALWLETPQAKSSFSGKATTQWFTATELRCFHYTWMAKGFFGLEMGKEMWFGMPKKAVVWKRFSTSPPTWGKFGTWPPILKAC